MKNRNRIISVLIALTLTLAMFAGCGGKASTSPAPAASKAPAASPAAKTPVSGGVLTVSQGTNQMEDNMFPGTAANADVLQNARPCLEPLFEIASDGTLIPFLVKEYKMEK